MNKSDVSDIEFFPIDVEQCDWATSQAVLMNIRREVFIDEQGVPEAEEFGEDDYNAIHWIAYGADNIAMGAARLLGDKVGRMAVLKPHRQRGVGGALLRQIIHYAAKAELNSIQLDAQLHAIPFYETMKFETEGAVFDDVGIPHQHMTLAMKHFFSPRTAPPTTDISAEDRRHIILDPNIFDTDALRNELFNFASQHPYAEIHILVQTPQQLVQKGHRLLHLSHRLPSRVQIRTFKPQSNTSHSEFMLIDQAGLLYKQSLNRYTGYAVNWSPLEAGELANEFDTLWNASQIDPELRNLPL